MVHIIGSPIYMLSILLLANAIGQISSSAIPSKRNDEDCHPIPQSTDKVYVVGYGSLLSTKSKNKTDPTTGTNIPVNVHGFSRKFNCKGTPVGHSTTYLGVDEEPNNSSAVFNGVIFRIQSHETLLEFDKREIFYCRKEVPLSQLEFLVDKNFNSAVAADFPTEGAQFWIYVVKEEFFGLPTERYPIVQSYVDVFLYGCIEMEETYNLTNYRDKCITSTEGWNYPWVNDRVLPRRPFVNTPRAFDIDRLIEKHIPDHFNKVFVEQEIKYNSKRNSATNLALNYLLTGFGFILTRAILL